MDVFVSLLLAIGLLGGCSKDAYPKEQNKFLALVKQGEIQWQTTKHTTAITFKDSGDGNIVVPVKINGLGKTRYFVVDTGAPTVVDISLAKELALRKIRDVTTGDSLSNVKSTPFVKLKSITIGDVTLKNINVLAADLKRGFGKKIDGILGSSTLTHFGVLINFKKHKFIISDGVKKWVSRSDKAIPFQQHLRAGLGPIIKCRIGDAVFPALIDTGASSFDIPLKAFQQTRAYKNHRYLQSIGQTSLGLHQVDNKVSSYFGVMDAIILGESLVVKKYPVYASKLTRDALLGRKFLRNFETVIDYPNHAVYFRPLGKKIHKEILTFGVGMLKKGDNITVISLWRGSDAYNKGLRVGDKILSINGKRSAGITQSEIFKMLNRRKSMEIVFKNSTGKHHVKLYKQSMLNMLSKTLTRIGH